MQWVSQRPSLFQQLHMTSGWPAGTCMHAGHHTPCQWPEIESDGGAHRLLRARARLPAMAAAHAAAAIGDVRGHRSPAEPAGLRTAGCRWLLDAWTLHDDLTLHMFRLREVARLWSAKSLMFLPVLRLKLWESWKVCSLNHGVVCSVAEDAHFTVMTSTAHLYHMHVAHKHSQVPHIVLPAAYRNLTLGKPLALDSFVLPNVAIPAY